MRKVGLPPTEKLHVGIIFCQSKANICVPEYLFSHSKVASASFFQTFSNDAQYTQCSLRGVKT